MGTSGLFVMGKMQITVYIKCTNFMFFSSKRHKYQYVTANSRGTLWNSWVLGEGCCCIPATVSWSVLSSVLMSSMELRMSPIALHQKRILSFNISFSSVICSLWSLLMTRGKSNEQIPVWLTHVKASTTFIHFI